MCRERTHFLPGKRVDPMGKKGVSKWVSFLQVIFFFTKMTKGPSAQSDIECHKEEYRSSLQILTLAVHSIGQGMMPSFPDSHRQPHLEKMHFKYRPEIKTATHQGLWELKEINVLFWAAISWVCSRRGDNILRARALRCEVGWRWLTQWRWADSLSWFKWVSAKAQGLNRTVGAPL